MLPAFSSLFEIIADLSTSYSVPGPSIALNNLEFRSLNASFVGASPKS